MRNQVGNAALAELHTLDLSELVFRLFSGDAVNCEATLGIVDETEVFASLVNGDDIHESSGECRVGANFAVDLDETLHNDGLDFTAVEGVLQSVAEEDDQWHAVTELVGTGRWAWCVCSAEFVKQPMRRGRKALHVFLSVEKILARSLKI
jgi:hypothetical protein